MLSALDVALVVGAVAIVAVAAIAALRRSQRPGKVAAVAAGKGLSYSSGDPFSSTSIAFALFCEGDGREVLNVVWAEGGAGASAGRPSPTHVFDYGFYRIHRDRYGREVKSWHWFTCAMAEPGGTFPTLRVQDMTVVGKVLEHFGGEPITFESEEFNETFRVTSEDRRFASALIDPRMMEFLLQTKGAVSFETRGRYVLLASHQLAPDELPILLGLADEFVRRIPTVVWDLYPKAVPGSDPDRVPPLPPMPPPPEPRLEDGPDAAWDPTPGVDYDLDGHPVTPAAHEDPWHDRPLPPHPSH